MAPKISYYMGERITLAFMVSSAGAANAASMMADLDADEGNRRSIGTVLRNRWKNKSEEKIQVHGRIEHATATYGTSYQSLHHGGGSVVGPVLVCSYNQDAVNFTSLSLMAW